MSSTNKLCLLLFTIIVASCNFKCTTGGDKNSTKAKTVTSSDNSPLNGAVIKNDIELDATGVKFNEVYLLDAEKNRITENATRIGEKIYLALRTDTGWIKENGLSYIGASERITTQAGNVIVDAQDIFKDYETTGLPGDQAKDITLSAVITEADAGLEDFIVQFRVWDKKGKGEIKGKYKFKLKK